eukprot:Seg4626.2 transcript_id=Seg4626.2/GoldUCD/mRNA.D3Y31 product="hypothetical protein" protein_id=Seg4626.2/GoldUCD/D3Y31
MFIQLFHCSKYLIVTPQVYRAGLAAEISVTLFNISERTVIKAKLTKGNDKMIERNVIFSPEDAGLLFQKYLALLPP